MGSQGKQKPKESAHTAVKGAVQNLLTSATCGSQRCTCWAMHDITC